MSCLCIFGTSYLHDTACRNSQSSFDGPRFTHKFIYYSSQINILPNNCHYEFSSAKWNHIFIYGPSELALWSFVRLLSIAPCQTPAQITILQPCFLEGPKVSHAPFKSLSLYSDETPSLLLIFFSRFLLSSRLLFTFFYVYNLHDKKQPILVQAKYQSITVSLYLTYIVSNNDFLTGPVCLNLLPMQAYM